MKDPRKKRQFVEGLEEFFNGLLGAEPRGTIGYLTRLRLLILPDPAANPPIS